jgi:hypothetical protein
MKRTGPIISGLAIALALFCQTALAQTTEFTYQGRLLSGGLPASGNHDFQFSLYDALTGGNQVGATVTLTDVMVDNGVFSVRIDFGNQFPGANRFLEIGVKESGAASFAVLAPRQSISSAPYSIKSLNSANATNATNAANLGGVKSDQFVVTGDSRLSDARVPLPGSASYIQNSTAQQASSSFNISGNGTTGGTLSGNVVRATTSFDILGNPILWNPGVGNTFAGIHAGTNTTGQNNSLLGFNAGGNNTIGNGNSFVGVNAGFSNTTGGGNSFLGTNAGFASTTGGGNSFFGTNAGDSNTTGSNNTLVGSASDLGSNGLTYASAIGANAIATSSDTIVLGKTAGTYSGISRPADAVLVPGNLILNGGLLTNNAASIGTTLTVSTDIAAGGALHVFGPGTVAGTLAVGGSMTTGGNVTTGGNLSANGSVAISKSLNVGTDISASGALQVNGPASMRQNLVVLNDLSTGGNLTSGGNIGVGPATPAARLTVSGTGGFTTPGSARFDLINTTNSPVGFSQLVTGNAVWQLLTTNSGDPKVSVSGQGLVGIGGPPRLDSRLFVNGSTYVDGQISVTSLGSGGTTSLCWNGLLISTCSSSIRYKSNINSFNSGLNLIKRLHPITFNWKSNNASDLGLVAEDVAAVEPLLVTHNSTGEIEGVKYDRVGVVLVNAVQEQQLQIESQQKQIDEQKEMIKRQQSELVVLKLLVCSQNPAADLCRAKNQHPEAPK